MSEAKQNLPYKNLGQRLKSLRQRLHESVAEVSGAVEIEPDTLSRIEQGEHCPSEDVLLLLLSHFNLQEDEAVKLWEMAGYDQDNMPSVAEAASSNSDDPSAVKPIVMIMQDSRVMYTDMVNVTVAQTGVVMNFLQNQGTLEQGSVVARLGMSRLQAERVMAALQHSLYQADQESAPKALPAPESTDQTQN